MSGSSGYGTATVKPEWCVLEEGGEHPSEAVPMHVQREGKQPQDNQCEVVERKDAEGAAAVEVAQSSGASAANRTVCR